MRKLVEMEDQNPFGHFLLGKYLEEQDNHTEALHHYQQAAALDSSTPAFHAALANCLSTQGQIDPAIASFSQASVLAPTFQKFSNQKDRLARKVAKANAR